ncbi:MAG TPA: FeoB-associated Cys-rich membrane protein [Clostridia bacterium]|jgi:hypothetical protein|nr:FeoB-associated Cys-rich membrane protein [Clostridia bacterium]HPY98638.1 FeoB-associated Cys-rich membrane protein [Clostridia bacterium]HQC68600.1 FeoB-associated Cys-rich membrane protein [Clostridia bacterium]
MNPLDYILIAIVALIVLSIVFYLIKSRKKGGSHNKCSACPYSGQCSDEKKKEEEK